MQIILGANGIIGEELARELHQNYTEDIVLVGRNPKQINATDILRRADLLQVDQAKEVVKGATIAYLTAGLPFDSEVWLRDWPKLLENVVNACAAEECKLVYFDNTYAYNQATSFQIEDSPISPSGKKGEGKKLALQIITQAMQSQSLEALICRAPEFYGPGKTKSITNTLVFESLQNGKKPKVLISDQTKRTLIYTPDASKAMALLGASPDCYGQTWHLPCDDDRLTYREIMAMISDQMNRKINYTVIPKWQLNLMSLFSQNLRETKELFPRYAVDNIFSSEKFKSRFPAFKTTSYREGMRLTLGSLLP